MKEPVNLRESDGRHKCEECPFFYSTVSWKREGECSMYANHLVHGSFVCDSHPGVLEEGLQPHSDGSLPLPS